MTKNEKTRALRALTPTRTKDVLERIVIGCIHEGRKLQMTSAEILDTICDVLREAHCEDPYPWTKK